MVAGVLVFVLLIKAINATVIVLTIPGQRRALPAARRFRRSASSRSSGGHRHGYALLPPEGLSLLLAASIVSITLNQLAFLARDRLITTVRASPGLNARLEEARGPSSRC
jgi:CPA2 family monovalent cation:H+ antiporter-2